MAPSKATRSLGTSLWNRLRASDSSYPPRDSCQEEDALHEQVADNRRMQKRMQAFDLLGSSEFIVKHRQV